jgi:hypothetical protein
MDYDIARTQLIGSEGTFKCLRNQYHGCVGSRFFNWRILALDGAAWSGWRVEFNIGGNSRVELRLHDEPN